MKREEEKKKKTRAHARTQRRKTYMKHQLNTNPNETMVVRRRWMYGYCSLRFGVFWLQTMQLLSELNKERKREKNKTKQSKERLIRED